MELSFTKLNSQWVIRSSEPDLTGATVNVPTRAGGLKPTTLGAIVGAKYGDYLYAIAQRPQPTPAATQRVGDLARIIAMFDTARQHLKRPAIVLDGFRVARAGDASREPGSLAITSIDRTHTDRFGNEARDWFGRVSLDGTFHPARIAPADLGDKLRAFAADPAGVAAAHGHLHGACCFCNRTLTDERSTSVGYGPDCADHFGLPWGGSRAASAGSINDIEAAADRHFDEADERAMQEAEARADREGTIRDERNKHRARAMMERRA